jgi:hypothetical protein
MRSRRCSSQQPLVLHVLSLAGPLAEDAIVAAVRDGFGYGAASANLRAGVHGAIGPLTEKGRIGIGGTGIGLIGNSGS